MKGELVNAFPQGVAVQGEPERWWNNPRFRLVPLFERRAADQWNRSCWWFDWLGFGIWNKGSPDISLQVTLNDLGLELRLEPPYLHVRWRIPLFPSSWHQKLWRKSPWP